MAIPALQALDQALAAAVQAVASSVVHVARGHGGGTGIAWSADLVISSSYHTPDRTRVDEDREAEVIGRDPGTDVAVLRVNGGGLTPAKFRELGDLGVGNLALAIGRPGRTARASLRAIGVLGPEIKTPWGGRLDRYVESDRQIPRGFAGGPLVDAEGAVIGMNTRTLLRGADLAVPTSTLRRVVDELVQHGGIRRGYLGVGAYPTPNGALVSSVEDGSPAGVAGVIAGDIIVELGGAAVSDPDSLRAAIADRPGETLDLVFLRGGAKQQLSVTLGSKA